MNTVEPHPYGVAILFGLQAKPVYAGTVPEATKQHRRFKNRQARVSRRINRVRDK